MSTGLEGQRAGGKARRNVEGTWALEVTMPAGVTTPTTAQLRQGPTQMTVSFTGVVPNNNEMSGDAKITPGNAGKFVAKGQEKKQSRKRKRDRGLEFQTTTTQSFLLASSSRCSSSDLPGGSP